MKTIFKYFFASIFVGLCGILYQVANHHHSANSTPTLAKLDNQKIKTSQAPVSVIDRSACRAARIAQLEKEAVADKLDIPVTYEMVDKPVGHVPAAKSTVAEESVADTKPVSVVAPQTSFLMNSANQSSTSEQPAYQDNAAHVMQQAPGYYPSDFGHGHHGMNHGSTPQAASQQPVVQEPEQQWVTKPQDESAYVPTKTSHDEFKDVGNQSRHFGASKNQPMSSAANPQEVDEELDLDEEDQPLTMRQKLKRLLAGLSHMIGLNWLANKFKKQQTPAIAELKDLQGPVDFPEEKSTFGDGGFPLWKNKSAKPPHGSGNSGSGHPGSGTPQPLSEPGVVQASSVTAMAETVNPVVTRATPVAVPATNVAKTLPKPRVKPASVPAATAVKPLLETSVPRSLRPTVPARVAPVGAVTAKIAPQQRVPRVSASAPSPAQAVTRVSDLQRVSVSAQPQIGWMGNLRNYFSRPIIRLQLLSFSVSALTYSLQVGLSAYYMNNAGHSELIDIPAVQQALVRGNNGSKPVVPNPPNKGMLSLPTSFWNYTALLPRHASSLRMPV